MNKVVLDKKDVAERLGISVVSLDRLRRRGVLPYRQIGRLVRFLQEDIDKYLENAKVEKKQ